MPTYSRECTWPRLSQTSGVIVQQKVISELCSSVKINDLNLIADYVKYTHFYQL